MSDNFQHEKKLGRGLSALFGESKAQKDISSFAAKEEGNSIEMISLSRIVAGVYQPRRIFNQSELEELADSIRENGLIQPIIVRKTDDEDYHYEIIAGERRFRACKITGLLEIPVIIKKINNHEALEMAIVENIQRKDLTLMEEAISYKQLIEEFSYTQEQVSKRVGKSRSHIANLLRLLSLPKSVHDLLNQDLLSMGHARAIVNSEDPEKLAKVIIEQSLTVRDVEDLVRGDKFDENISNDLVSIRKETKIRLVNSEHLLSMENKLAEFFGMEAKISYNSFKNSGKITLKFDELERVQYLLDTIAVNNIDQ